MMDKYGRVLDLYDRLRDPYEIVHDAKTEAKYYNVTPATITKDLKCIRNYLRSKAIDSHERLLKDIKEKELFNYDYYIEEDKLEFNKSAGVYTIKRYTIEAKDFKKIVINEEVDKLKSKLKSLQNDEV